MAGIMYAFSYSRYMKVDSPVISIRRLKKVAVDPEATAKAVKLVYVNSADEGITRIRNGKGFYYQFRNKKVSDKKTLDRIRITGIATRMGRSLDMYS